MAEKSVRGCLTNLVRFFIALWTSLAIIACAAAPTTGEGDWRTYGHDYGNQRYSSLNEINTGNVHRLIPAYVFQTSVVGPFETSPLVSGGAMYITTANDGLLAIDAADGRLIWKKAPLPGGFRQCCGPVNRGVAIADGLVIMGRLDCSLLAFDQQNGSVKWRAKICDNTLGYSITMAPVIYRDSVIVGAGGGEFGIRGFLSAYSVRDGALKWRWYATDPQHWFGKSSRLRTDAGIVSANDSLRLRGEFRDSWRRGGGGIWTTPSVDVRRNAIYVTTGNPWPDLDGSERPGDNLFTDCIVALDASTGKMKWYFQEVPHDTRDLDAASPPFLFDGVAGGRKVAALGQIGKTGVLYVLDRETGRLIYHSRDLATVTSPTQQGRWAGGSSWSPVSFDPQSHLAIMSSALHLIPRRTVPPKDPGREMAAEWKRVYGLVSAIDVMSGQIVWQDEFDAGEVGGSATTAGGITFVGEGSGYFDALDTRDGKRLWQFQTGAGVNAPPIVFQVDGTEYVAVASGGNEQFGTPYGDALFVFRLDER